MGRLKAIITGLILCTTSLVSNAGLIYDFDVSDTSWASRVDGDFTGASIMAEFKVTTDFYNLQDSDLLSIGFTIVEGTRRFAIEALNVGNLDEMFIINNGSLLWEYGGGPSRDIFVNGNNGSFMQVMKTSTAISMAFSVGSGMTYANTDGQNLKSSLGVLRISVPEPSTLAIFSLGIMGLVSRRIKEQS